jgi:putative SOS response-associated peptidase YedK
MGGAGMGVGVFVITAEVWQLFAFVVVRSLEACDQRCSGVRSGCRSRRILGFRKPYHCHMSVQYESLPNPALYLEAFGVAAPQTLPGAQVWPRRPGVFIRAVPAPSISADAAGQASSAEPLDGADGVGEGSSVSPPILVREALVGQLGLVPKWVKSASDAKLRSTKLVNARQETVTTSTAFRGAWLAGQRCIVPMQAFQEEDLRSGKPVPTRVARVDGRAMGVAGLWECWEDAQGNPVLSFCLLTVNANSHALIRRYQQPGAEKRMLAVLNEGSFDAWLQARPDKAKAFLRPYPAERLTANPIERGRRA